MKATSTLFSALATWLLIAVTATVLPANRIGAQQSGAADNKKDVDLARRLEKAHLGLEKAKAEMAELRMQLEKERQRAEQAESEALAQRDAARQAEAEARRQAQQALAAEQTARQEGEKARQEADRARYAAQLHAAQEAFARGKEHAGKVGGKQLQPELERMKAELLTRFQAQRVALMTQLKLLDEEQQRVLEELARKAASLPGKAEPAGSPARLDGLHQILERLERIEKRLDRLEKQAPRAP